MRAIIGAIVGVAALATPADATAATIVNVSATAWTGTWRQFDAGRYAMEFIGIADGGAYDAYGVWHHMFPFTDPRSGSNCQDGTAQCRFGYQNNFWTTIGGVTRHYRLASDLTPPIAGHYRFATTGAALAAAQAGPYSRPLEFSVAAPTPIRFSVDGGSPWDNEGGVSLRITEVPEPATWLFLVAGFGLIGAAKRYRRPGFTSA